MSNPMNKIIKEHGDIGFARGRVQLPTSKGTKLAYLYVIILSLAFTFPSFALLYGGQREGLRGEVIYSDTQITKCIISEAIGESEQGQIAVAFVFKTRLEKGLSLGSCGYKRKDIDEFIARQPKSKVERVKFLWNLVKQNKLVNPVPDCTHFENIRAFGVPYWAKDMIEVKTIGNHTFYKPLTKGEKDGQ
jgi:hypothetical protein